MTSDVTGNAINQTDVASTLQQCFCRRRFPHGRSNRCLQHLITIRALFLSQTILDLWHGPMSTLHGSFYRMVYKVYITKQMKFTILNLPRQGYKTKTKFTLWIQYSCWGVLQNYKRNKKKGELIVCLFICPYFRIIFHCRKILFCVKLIWDCFCKVKNVISKPKHYLPSEDGNPTTFQRLI